MAFHLGSLGFLTPFEFDNFQEQVTNVLEGNWKEKSDIILINFKSNISYYWINLIEKRKTNPMSHVPRKIHLSRLVHSKKEKVRLCRKKVLVTEVECAEVS